METVTCKQCKKEFKTYKCRLKAGKSKYCSKKCSNLSMVGNSGYWLGKKRPDLKSTNAFKTMFKKGIEVWNKGMKGFMSGSKNGNWNGGEYVDGKYIRVNFDSKHHWKHRVIMEKHLGRKLNKNEVVHHINHNTLDNRIENLTVMDKIEHNRLHLAQFKGGDVQ